MALYKLTGVDDYSTIGKSKRRKEKQAKRKEKRSSKKTKRKEKRTARKEKRKTKTKRILKVAAAPARAAMLILVRLNFLKLGTKFAQAWAKDKAKVTRFWTNAGGKIDKFKEAIASGSKQKISGLGSVSVGAAIAAATPLLILTTQLLKELNLVDKTEENALNDAADEGAMQLENDPDIEKSFAEFPDDGGENKVLPIDKSATETPADDSADDSDDEGKNKNTMLLIGGAAALFLLMKK